MPSVPMPVRLWMWPLSAAVLVGCASPPSVAPLMRVTERALRDEAALLEVDRQRQAAALDASRTALADAFARDLEQAEALTPRWVAEATDVYVAAREALVRHEAALAAEHAARRDNLLAAAEAQRRALGLLERQDRLIVQTVGTDLWRWLVPLNPSPEATR